VSDESKTTPTRPGSQWATGKRRAQARKYEPVGFHQGARVSSLKPAPTPAKPQRNRRRQRP
jgi:hypothetical protein